ncbi:MAG: hypothetical protein ABSD21_12005 [Rhizomicrobium sp.]|jgi:hypothetical protein
MSVQTRIVGLSLAIALFSGTAMADPVIQKANPSLPNGGVYSIMKCAPGFAANPATATNDVGYYGGHTYTCTGPVIFCMSTYVLISPVTIQGGHMVYTCKQPEKVH